MTHAAGRPSSSASRKRFPGVAGARGRQLRRSPRARCHALCGENGAGKSTLGKILAGIHAPDAGQVLVDGRPVRLRRPAGTRCAAGIGMVHQELAFCENLTVAENLCLGSLPPTRGVRVARARWCARAERDAGGDRRRRSTSRRPMRRADDRPAAAGADRRRGRRAARGSSSSTSRRAACRSTRRSGSTS